MRPFVLQSPLFEFGYLDGGDMMIYSLACT